MHPITLPLVQAIQRSWDWLMSSQTNLHAGNNPTERFIESMKTTASARFAASVRLRYKSEAYFITSTIFSLGLILIALLQLTGIPLKFNNQVLTAMTAFLAVSVLVYSVTAGTAHHEVRAEQLNECGDRIKKLVRSIEREYSSGGGQLASDKLAIYEHEYHLVITDTEPHNRNDFRRTLLDMKGPAGVTGLVRLIELTQYYFLRFIEHIPHLALLSVEVVFMSDMLGYSAMLKPLLDTPI